MSPAPPVVRAHVEGFVLIVFNVLVLLYNMPSFFAIIVAFACVLVQS